MDADFLKLLQSCDDMQTNFQESDMDWKPEGAFTTRVCEVGAKARKLKGGDYEGKTVLEFTVTHEIADGERSGEKFRDKFDTAYGGITIRGYAAKLAGGRAPAQLNDCLSLIHSKLPGCVCTLTNAANKDGTRVYTKVSAIQAPAA